MRDIGLGIQGHRFIQMETYRATAINCARHMSTTKRNMAWHVACGHYPWY